MTLKEYLKTLLQGTKTYVDEKVAEVSNGGNIDLSDYETTENAQLKLNEAKTYADSAATQVKNDLLNGAGAAYDTLKELGDLIDVNVDAIEALETVASGKADKEHTHNVEDIVGLDIGGGASVQADWEQTDPTASNYIKNRPFHDIGEENTLYSDISTFVLNDSDTSNIHGILWQAGTLWTLIAALKDVCVVGNTYYITMQEKTYSCECFSYTTENNTEISLLGNRRYFLGTGYDETNEPFLIVNGTEVSAILLPNGNGYELKYDNTIELNITIASAPVKPIDRKYLPKGMLLREETYLTGQPGWGKNSEYFNNLTPQAAFGEGSHAEGDSANPIPETITKTTPISDINSIWYNNSSQRFLMAAGKDSHAEGYGTLASGDYSHAEGEFAFAQGLGSHAEGGGHAQGKGSHAEGLGQAFGNLSHAEGYGSTMAEAAHAEGSGHAEGSHSHAEGENTKAVGRNSHAEGNNTVAQGDHQHVQGMYNIIDYDNKYAHIVGNGYHNNRRNIHTLDWQGNAWFEGNGRFDGAVFSNGVALAKVSSIPTKISQLENDSNFVLKEDGKGLSTNDYTNEDKQLLADLANVAETGQSDYSINDETHPAFIKNRPVYDIPEIKISTDTWHWGNEPVESEKVPGVFASTAMGIVHGKDNSTVEGDLYDVIINGIKYTSPLKKIDNTCALGNSYIGYIIGSLEIEKTTDTGEPYFITWGAESFDDNDDQIAVIGCINSLANSALNSNVEIYKSQIIKKLDAKFLPDNIGGTQADWNETDETSPSFIKNKPSINADGTVILQSDWNETNEQSSAHIKNKPFGKEVGEKQSLLSLGEVSFSNGESEFFNIPENVVIKAGDIIEFQYDGIDYNWSILEYTTNVYVAGPGETIQDIMAGNIAILFDLDGMLSGAGMPIWTISLMTPDAETETHVCKVDYIEVNTNTIDPIYIKDLYYDEENKQIILPSTTIPFDKEQMFGAVEVWGIPVGSDFVPTSGTTYQVNWNGVKYESQCDEFYHEQLGNFVYIGNLGLMSELLGTDFGISNTGEPYLYAYSPEEQQGILLDLEHSAELSEVENTVEMCSIEKKFQSLKEKYLSILKPVDNEIVYIKEANIRPLGQEDGAFVYMFSFNDASCFLGGNPVYITLDNQIFIPDVIDTSVAAEWTMIKLDENTGEELFVIGYFEPQNMGILFSKNMVSKIKASSTLVSNVIKEEYLPETIATKDFVLNTISELNGIILKSSTEGSSKKFKLTITDDGVLSTEEVTN